MESCANILCKYWLCPPVQMFDLENLQNDKVTRLTFHWTRETRNLANFGYRICKILI